MHHDDLAECEQRRRAMIRDTRIEAAMTATWIIPLVLINIGVASEHPDLTGPAAWAALIGGGWMVAVGAVEASRVRRIRRMPTDALEATTEPRPELSTTGRLRAEVSRRTRRLAWLEFAGYGAGMSVWHYVAWTADGTWPAVTLAVMAVGIFPVAAELRIRRLHRAWHGRLVQERLRLTA